MKRGNNNSGFTMVELLVVIAILGILTVLVIFSFSNFMRRSQDEYYKSQEEMLILAAREYYSDYRSELPKEIGAISSVTVQTLVSLNYIDEVVGYNNELCDLENSEVKVLKVSDEDYQYEASLLCDGYQSDVSIVESTAGPNINITYNITGNNGYRIYQEESKIPTTIQNGTKKLQFSFHIEVSSSTNASQIVSYTYQIIKAGQSSAYMHGAEDIRESNSFDGNVEVMREGEEITEDGEYILTVSATDQNGNTKTKSSPLVLVDNTPPDCEIDPKTRNSKSSSVIFDITVSDENEITNQTWQTKNWIEEEQDDYGQTENISSNTVQISSSDDTLGYNRGLLTVLDFSQNYCQVDTKAYAIVLETPEVEQYSGWQKSGDTFDIEAETNQKNVEDKIAKWQIRDSDIWRDIENSSQKKNVSYQLNVPQNTLINERYGFRVCLSETDQELCSEEGSTLVQIDREVPSCTTSGGGSNWSSSDITIIGTCHDGTGSGCANETISKAFSRNGESNESPGIVSDLVGNETVCGETTVKIDKEKPTVSYSYNSGSYITSQLSITIAGHDNIGIGRMQIHIYKDGNLIEHYDNNNSTNVITLSANGNFTVYTKVFDLASNKQEQSPDNGSGWYYQSYTISNKSATVLNNDYIVCPEDQLRPSRNECIDGKWNSMYVSNVTTNATTVSFHVRLHTNATYVTFDNNHPNRTLCIANTNNQCVYNLATFSIRRGWTTTNSDVINQTYSIPISSFSAGDYRIIVDGDSTSYRFKTTPYVLNTFRING